MGLRSISQAREGRRTELFVNLFMGGIRVVTVSYLLVGHHALRH